VKDQNDRNTNSIFSKHALALVTTNIQTLRSTVGLEGCWSLY